MLPSPSLKPLTLGVSQDPLRQAMRRLLLMVDHTSMPMGQTGAEAAAIIDLPGQPFDGLNERIARVAIT